MLRQRASIVVMERPRLLSVPEAAAELKASDAHVRRLLISQRLYGIKVGPVWAIFQEDLEIFKRLRRPPGRPPKANERPSDERERRLRITSERAAAGSDALLRKPRRSREAQEAERT